MTENFINLTAEEQIKAVHANPYVYVTYLEENRNMLLSMLDGYQRSAEFSLAKPSNASGTSDVTAKVALERQKYEEPANVFVPPTTDYEAVSVAVTRYKSIVESFSGDDKTFLKGRLEGKKNKDFIALFKVESAAITKRLNRITTKKLDMKISNYMRLEEEQRIVLGL